MDLLFTSLGFACDLVALSAVVVGHILVPRDPQLTWRDLWLELATYTMEDSAISN